MSEKLEPCPKYLRRGCWETFTSLSGGIRDFDCEHLDKKTHTCRKGFYVAMNEHHIPKRNNL